MPSQWREAGLPTPFGGSLVPPRRRKCNRRTIGCRDTIGKIVLVQRTESLTREVQNTIGSQQVHLEQVVHDTQVVGLAVGLDRCKVAACGVEEVAAMG